jgi:hypothetical protein
MKLTRKLIIAQPDFKHVLEFRCAMHAFGSTLGSITNHKYFKDIICEAQTIVTFFRSSHQPLAYLHYYGSLDRSTNRKTLKTSNHTRITSVGICCKSVLLFEEAFNKVVRQHADIFNTKKPSIAAVVATLKNRSFWSELELVCELLETLCFVIMAVQTIKCTLADVAIYWIYLTNKMEYFCLSDKFEDDVTQHLKNAFNKRAKEMNNIYYQLALFLHPHYKKEAYSCDETVLRNLYKAAVSVMISRGSSKEELEVLISQLKDYNTGGYPYSRFDVDEHQDVRIWWTQLPQHSCSIISNLADILFSCVPHGGSIERTFSLKGWVQSKLKNSTSDSKTFMVTSVKTYYDNDHRNEKQRRTKKRKLEKTPREESEEPAKSSEIVNLLEDEEVEEVDVGDTQLADIMESLKSAEDRILSEEEAYEIDMANKLVFDTGAQLISGTSSSSSSTSAAAVADQLCDSDDRLVEGEEGDILDSEELADALDSLGQVLDDDEGDDEEIFVNIEQAGPHLLYKVKGIDYSSPKFQKLTTKESSSKVVVEESQQQKQPFNGSIDSLLDAAMNG